MRYSLRTLLIFLILLPPLGAAVWRESVMWRERSEQVLWIDVGGPGTISSFSGISCLVGFDPEEVTAEVPTDEASSETIEVTERP